jgi:hypothetical protein
LVVSAAGLAVAATDWPAEIPIDTRIASGSAFLSFILSLCGKADFSPEV